MLKHIWTVLCRRSVIDQETNNLSIHDVFEQIEVDVKVNPDKQGDVKEFNVPIEYEVINFWMKVNDEKAFASHFLFFTLQLFQIFCTQCLFAVFCGYI